MLRRLLSVLWYLGATLVVVAALGLSLARLALPMLESRAGQLEALVKDAVGHEVQLGRLEVAWQGLGPELRVYDVILRDQATAQKLLTASELRIDFSLLQSLWAWRPIPTRLVLLGSDVSMLRDQDGHLVVEGIRQQVPQVNPWLLIFSQPHVELRDIRLHWRDALGQIPELILSNIDLHMRNRGNRHQVEIDLQLPAEYGSHLQVMADLIGDTDHPEAWGGEMYLALDQAPLAHWLTRQLPEGWQLAGEVSGAFWLDLQSGAVRHLQGKLDIANPQIANGDAGAEQLFGARRVTTRVDWRRPSSSQENNGWTLSLDQLRVQQDDGDWPETGLTVAVTPAVASPDAPTETGQRMQVAVDYLRIEAVLPLLTRFLPVEPAQIELMRQLNPEGELRGLQLAFTRHDGRNTDLVYRTRFSDLHNTAYERIPGVAALNGSLSGNGQRGVLQLDTHAAHVVFPKLFREPLQLSKLTGRVDWQRLDDRLRIDTTDLVAANADIRTRSRLRMDFPTDGSKPLIDLQSTFAEGRMQSTYKYLPVGIMPAHTVEWLDTALVSGRISSGGVLYQGRVGDFPFDHATGRMEVRATVRDAVLDYKQGWHRIEGLEAELAFINRSMQIHAVAGKVLGSDLQDVDVHIDDLAHARLIVAGNATGSLADMLRFLHESPLGSGSAAALGELQATGNAQLKLGLQIPLAEHKPPEVDGLVTLNDNGLALPAWDINLEKLQGAVHFTQQKVDGQDLHATLFNVPVTINVDDAQLGRHTMTRVRATGRLPLLERLKNTSEVFAEHFKGTGNWSAAVSLPKQGDSGISPQIELRSGLRGISIDLPQPLGKSADLERNLVLRADIKAQGLGPLQVQYGEHSAAFELERTAAGMAVSRAEIKFSAADAQLPDTAGVQVSGRLPLFVWDEWRTLLSGGAAVGGLHQLDLTLDESLAFGRRFRQIQVDAQRNETGWEAQLKGPDLQGSLEMPAAANAPLRLRFAQLTIPPRDSGIPQATLNPGSLPRLDVEVQKLLFGDLDLGKVDLTSHPVSSGLAVDELQVQADWIKFTAAGEWTQHAGQDASRFRIDMQGGDLGKMLAAFGYAGSVEGGDTRGEIDANWPGTPTDFTLAKLEGSLAVHIGEGRLMNVETGAGRVFGLFSLQALRRRLSLDFSDVFEKGFSFDSINGKFSLLDGDAYTNDLVVDGPAARIEISGRTGLARQDYDQLVTVVPKVQSTLPIAGALAGGPVVGAALLLADKLFAQQLEGLTSFTRYQYTVTGSWDDPQFKQLPKEPARPLQQDQTTTGNRQKQK